MADKFNFDVFLSHNGKDKPAVENIARLLRDAYNLKAWLDKWHLVPGEAWQEGLEDALDECQTFAVFLGPSGIGPWENEEMRSAISDRVQDKNRRVIPVLLPGAPDNRDLDLPRFLKRATWVDFRSGLDDKEALYRLYCGITGQAPGDLGSSTSPKTPTTADWHIAHPYPMPPNFTGRAAEQKMLDDWLSNDKDRLFILRALGGFGKSALTWQWINTHVNPAEWTKLVFWSFYEGDASFEHFIEETLKYLKLEIPQGQRPQVDQLLKTMQSQKILLIMDGFERALRAYSSMNAAYQGDEPKIEDNQLDCVNINAEFFLKGVYSLPNIKSKVLMTTRLTPRVVKPHGEFMLGCCEVELTSMQPADAVEFFHKQKIKGTHAEIEAACAPYGYHPLSLRILTGLINHDRESPGDIKATEHLDITDNIVQNKNHVLKFAYDYLSDGQQKLLSNIACLRSPIGYQVLKYISSKPSWKRGKNKPRTKENLNDDLQTLENRGLLQWNRKTNNYDLHPIVRRYAYEQMKASDRILAHRRLRDHFAAIDVPKQPRTLDDLSPVIELYHHTVRAGQLNDASSVFYKRLSNTLHFQFGAYEIMAELLLALFPNDTNGIPQLDNKSLQAWVLYMLALSYSRSGHPHQSIPIYQKKNQFHTALNDNINLAVGLGAMALTAYIPIGTLKEAELNIQRRISICKEMSNVFEEAVGHVDLGKLLAYLGLWKESKQELDTAWQMFANDHNIQSQSVAAAFQSLSALMMSRDLSQSSIENHNLAIESAQKTLELAEEQARTEHPVEYDFLYAHWLLGAAYRLNNKLDFAERHLSESFTRCRAINSVEVEADILLDLARLRYDQTIFEEAKSLSEEALSITERCGYVLQGADVNLFLAQYALEQEQDKTKAKQYAEEAKKLATCDGPPYYYKVAYEEAERFLENLK